MQKHRFKFDKLIRDKLPETLQDQGVSAALRVLESEEYILHLKKKLIEEGEEVFCANSVEELTEELADVLEVINALSEINGVSFKEIEEARVLKNEKRGNFQNRIYCEYVELIPSPQNQDSYNYYRSHPQRYPEID